MLVLAALLMVVFLGLIAFAVDMGYIMLVRTQLQVAADSATMAAASQMGGEFPEVLTAARQYAGYHAAGGAAVELKSSDVEFRM